MRTAGGRTTIVTVTGPAVRTPPCELRTVTVTWWVPGVSAVVLRIRVAPICPSRSSVQMKWLSGTEPSKTVVPGGQERHLGAPGVRASVGREGEAEARPRLGHARVVVVGPVRGQRGRVLQHAGVLGERRDVALRADVGQLAVLPDRLL